MNLQITKITADIRLVGKPGPLKAYADVKFHTTEGNLYEKGYAIVQKDGGAPFIGFPSRPGNTPGRFFPIVEAEGDIRNGIIGAILAAYLSIGKM
jgi:hypothetical protein